MALNANELHITAPSPEGVTYTSLWLHIYSDEQLVEATWQRARRPCLAVHMGVKCTESGMLQSSMDRAARPRYRTNLALRTPWTNLTSAAPTASSAAQTIGENEDSYVRSYIQTQSTGLHARWRYSCSSAEKMKDSVTAEDGNYSNAGLSIKPRGPALWNMTSHCGWVKTAA